MSNYIHNSETAINPPYLIKDGGVRKRLPSDGDLILEVPGAGWIAFGNNAGCRCGRATGCTVDPSWSQFGYSGGVMDRSDMRKLRDHLTELLKEGN